MSATYLRPERGRFDCPTRLDANDIRAARQLVKLSGAVPMLERWREADRKALGLRGARRSWASFEQMLTLICAMAHARASQNITDMTSVLVWGMDDETRQELGLDVTGKTDEQVYGCLYRSYHALLDIVDPFPGPRNKKLTKDAFGLMEKAVDSKVRAVRVERLHDLCNALLMATFKLLPREVRRRYKGNIVVDGTFVPSYGQHGTYTSSRYMGIEPHAAWWQRDGDHDGGREVDGQTKLKKVKNGWEATLAVMGTNDPEREQTFPLLVLAIAMHTPGAKPGANAINALRRVFEEGLPAKYLAGDRAYGNVPLPEEFQERAREMGYELLFDIRSDELGKTFQEDGVVILEGNAYCPSILGKPALVTATRDYRVGDETGKRITRDVWYERIVARAKYLLQPRTSMARDGSQQVRCPATGPNPTLACPLRPGASQPSLMPVTRRSLPLVDLRGSVCNNAGGTQVLDGEHWNRHAMGMQFGTDRWARHYTSLRQTVESFNRYVKDSAFAGLANPDRRRVRGFASCFLLVTTLLMAGNTRKASRWLSKPVKVDSRGRGPLKRRADEEATPRRRDLTYGRERRAPGRPPPISPDAPAPLPWVSPAAN